MCRSIHYLKSYSVSVISLIFQNPMKWLCNVQQHWIQFPNTCQILLTLIYRSLVSVVSAFSRSVDFTGLIVGSFYTEIVSHQWKALKNWFTFPCFCCCCCCLLGFCAQCILSGRAERPLVILFFFFLILKSINQLWRWLGKERAWKKTQRAKISTCICLHILQYCSKPEDTTC